MLFALGQRPRLEHARLTAPGHRQCLINEILLLFLVQ
jgi:hypothetical protein